MHNRSETMNEKDSSLALGPLSSPKLVISDYQPLGTIPIYIHYVYIWKNNILVCTLFNINPRQLGSRVCCWCGRFLKEGLLWTRESYEPIIGQLGCRNQRKDVNLGLVTFSFIFFSKRCYLQYQYYASVDCHMAN